MKSKVQRPMSNVRFTKMPFLTLDIGRWTLDIVSNSHGTFERAARVKVFEQVALVRLVPTNLVCWYRSDVQAIDIWGVDKTAT